MSKKKNLSSMKKMHFLQSQAGNFQESEDYLSVEKLRKKKSYEGNFTRTSRGREADWIMQLWRNAWPREGWIVLLRMWVHDSRSFSLLCWAWKKELTEVSGQQKCSVQKTKVRIKKVVYACYICSFIVCLTQHSNFLCGNLPDWSLEATGR